jgi:hypothetical protein
LAPKKNLATLDQRNAESRCMRNCLRRILDPSCGASFFLRNKNLDRKKILVIASVQSLLIKKRSRRLRDRWLIWRK